MTCASTWPWTQPAGKAWPRPQPPLVSLVPSFDPRRYGPDWQEVQQEQREARAAAAQREEAEALAQREANWIGPKWWKGEKA